MTKPIEIVECTLRDGSYAVDLQFTAEDTFAICRALEGAGFSRIEIGHGFGLGASGPQLGIAAATDEQYLEAAASALTSARFGAFLIPGVGTLQHLDLARKYGMHFVRIGTNITRSETAEPFIKYAKDLGFEVSYNGMRSPTPSLRKSSSTGCSVPPTGGPTVFPWSIPPGACSPPRCGAMSS